MKKVAVEEKVGMPDSFVASRVQKVCGGRLVTAKLPEKTFQKKILIGKNSVMAVNGVKTVQSLFQSQNLFNLQRTCPCRQLPSFRLVPADPLGGIKS